MAVYKGSRYENENFTGILGADGRVRRYVHARQALTADDVIEPAILHAFKYGEIIDEIPFRSNKKSRLWWLVAEVSGLIFPLDVEPGVPITIPVRQLEQRGEFG